MPYERPARGVYISAPAILNHGQAFTMNGLVGIVIKQDEPSTFDPLSTRTQVAPGKECFLRTKGEAQVPAVAGATLGAPVYIDTATQALSLVDTATTIPMGRVSGLPGVHGCPSDQLRVDMDLKDNAPNPA